MKHLLGWFMKIGSLFLILPLPSSFAQTILQPGDLVVIGLGANVGGDLVDCDNSSGFATGRDLVSFVCFQDIEPGTVIDITDNGWERDRTDLWGNVEGFLRATRSGRAIPAGTVITFEFPPMGTDYLARTPDRDWVFESLGTNSLNFNSDGDQLYFMQGGQWDNGTTMGCCNGNQDATYSGGRILFGFNSKTNWNALADDSKDSGLHPEVTPCFHMEPTGGTTNYISYTGSFEPATQLEWIGRIGDAANWSTFPDCASFLAGATLIPALPVNPNEIALECLACEGCPGYTETLTFRLPDTEGPYQVEYTDGRDTFLAQDVFNGDLLSMTIDQPSRFEVVSIVNNSGCPLYSNFGEGSITRIVQNLQFVESGFMGAWCPGSNDGRGQIVFSGGTAPFTLEWIGEDTVSVDSLVGNTFYLSEIHPGDYTFIVRDAAGCQFSETNTMLAGSAQPIVACTITQQPDAANPNGQVEVEVSGPLPAPYTIDWSGPATGSDQLPGVGALTLANLPPGTYETVITANNGCAGACSFTIQDPACSIDLSCDVLNQVSAVDGSDGEAMLSFGGGNPPYDISWTGPVTGSVTEDFAATIILSSLPAGNHTVTIMDADSCSNTCTFEITQPTCDTELLLTVERQVCGGQTGGSLTAELNGATGQVRYNWSDDALDGLANPTGLAPGNYTLIAIDEANCRDTATAELIEMDGITADISASATGCDFVQGSILVSEINGGAGPFSFSVDGSDFSPINNLPYTVSGYTAGNYLVEVRDNANCSFSAEVSISETEPPVLALTKDLTIKVGDSVLIEAIANFTPSQVIWEPSEGLSHPDSLITFAQPLVSTTYRLRAINAANCEAEGEISIFVDQTRSLFVPSAFTPNNDGRNDLLTVFGGEDILGIKSFHVFDRWGGLVFQTENISLNNQGSGWDGTFQGQLMPAGTYVYFAEVIFSGNVEEVIEGSVTLIR